MLDFKVVRLINRSSQFVRNLRVDSRHNFYFLNNLPIHLVNEIKLLLYKYLLYSYRFIGIIMKKKNKPSSKKIRRQ